MRVASGQMHADFYVLVDVSLQLLINVLVWLSLDLLACQVVTNMFNFTVIDEKQNS